MQIAVAAQSLTQGQNATGVHYCNVIAIGKPVAAIA